MLAGFVVTAFLLAWMFQGLFRDPSTYGMHDWDAHSVYRLSPLLHLLHREGPWWNPWMCGGFPDWGYVEGATNVVSPYLPAYLFLPLQLAERLEVVGETFAALVGTYLLAGRATSLVSVRTFCAVVYAWNGRWAMQAAVGHTWHLRYAWTPLVLYFFVRSVEEKRWGWAAWGGVICAGMLYQGAIYPLPHTALVLGAFCLLYAITSRSWLPFAYGALLGAIALGLSAPKLVPVLLTMRRFPRTIASTEQFGVEGLLGALVARGQTFTQGPVTVSQWGWHEYGTYVGWPVVVAALAFFLLGRGPRELGLRVLALGLFAVSLGAFASWAPWSLLHRLPIFDAQHVPSRFTQVALLVTVFGIATMAERWSRRLGERRAWVDLALLAPVLWIAADLAGNARYAFDHAFGLRAPDAVAAPVFRHAVTSTTGYLPLAHRGAMLPSMHANVGVLDCYGYPLSYRYTDGIGALATTSSLYRGEAYTIDPRNPSASGEATIVRWTPNTATVRLARVGGGEQLVYNMNADPGWSANGRRTFSAEGRVAVVLAPDEREVRFRYRPPGLTFGLVVGGLTVAGCLAVAIRQARRRRSA